MSSVAHVPLHYCRSLCLAGMQWSGVRPSRGTVAAKNSTHGKLVVCLSRVVNVSWRQQCTQGRDAGKTRFNGVASMASVAGIVAGKTQHGLRTQPAAILPGCCGLTEDQH